MKINFPRKCSKGQLMPIYHFPYSNCKSNAQFYLIKFVKKVNADHKNATLRNSLKSFQLKYVSSQRRLKRELHFNTSTMG